jgi:hypothetical protein
VYSAAPPESADIAATRQKYELEKAAMQHKHETEKYQHSLRRQNLAATLEDLTYKIKHANQFEQEAMKMVLTLKKDGQLTAAEEKMLLEIIRDKVMEEFHGGGRGGRTRWYMDEIELRRKLALEQLQGELKKKGLLKRKEYQFWAEQYVIEMKAQGLIDDKEGEMLRKMIKDRILEDLYVDR